MENHRKTILKINKYLPNNKNILHYIANDFIYYVQLTSYNMYNIYNQYTVCNTLTT